VDMKKEWDVIKSRSFKLAVINTVVLLLAYVCGWKFEGRYSLYLTPLYLAALLLFITAFLNSLFFWLLQFRKQNKTYMPLLLNVGVACFWYLLPSLSHSKANPVGIYCLITNKQNSCNPGLFLEYYKIMGGGYMTTDVNAVYLTDRKSFRKYLFDLDEEGDSINISCNGGKIAITKTTNIGDPTTDTVRRNVFDLMQLRQEGRFE
jgi:hypothetical protein